MDIFSDDGNFNTKYALNSSLDDDFELMTANILDTRRSEWRNRVNMWKSIGIDSSLGRDDNLTFNDLNVNGFMGTSIFDPVLTELMYQWFCPKNGSILDPFAGGSVRGVVAGYKGHHYIGIDLSKRQIDADNQQIKDCGIDKKLISYYVDDALNIEKYVSEKSQDMIIACPPYYDLEKYSDNEHDLSNMNDNRFSINYCLIIDRIVKKLKNNRFAVFVVSNIRNKKGYYRDLVSLTNQAMQGNGLRLYNEAILINSLGTGGLRASRTWHNHKLINQFQNVLIYYKGNPNKIKEVFQ